MEARWGANALTLDKERLVLQPAGQPEVAVPLQALMGFAVVETSEPAEGRARVSTPDALLVVAWQELGLPRRAQMPVPREGLQVQLLLARLAQLKPDADMREVKRDEVVRFFEVQPSAAQAPAGLGQRRIPLPVLVGLLVAVAAAGLAALFYGVVAGG